MLLLGGESEDRDEKSMPGRRPVSQRESKMLASGARVRNTNLTGITRIRKSRSLNASHNTNDINIACSGCEGFSFITVFLLLASIL